MIWVCVQIRIPPLQKSSHLMLPMKMAIWVFPEIGVPPNHPFLDRIFPDKPSSYWGTPILGNPHIIIYNINHYQPSLIIIKPPYSMYVNWAFPEIRGYPQKSSTLLGFSHINPSISGYLGVFPRTRTVKSKLCCCRA